MVGLNCHMSLLVGSIIKQNSWLNMNGTVPYHWNLNLLTITLYKRTNYGMDHHRVKEVYVLNPKPT